MVSENNHTPTTEGIGNSGGVGGGIKGPGNLGEEGVFSEITFPDGQVRCRDNLFQKSLLTDFAARAGEGGGGYKLI